MMIFYFWQNTISMHQVHWLKSLAERHEVHWLVDHELRGDRASQGWVRPDTGRIQVRIVKPSDVVPILNDAPRCALHVLAPRGCMSAPFVLKAVRARRLRYAFLAEKPNETGAALWMRGLLYRSIAFRFSKAEQFMAMGERGALWYSKHGFRNVHPFGYTVRDTELDVKQEGAESYKFICIAQMIPQKNHRVMFEALASISGSWSLECIGRGPLSESLKALVLKLGLGHRVNWIESLPNSEARKSLAQADTLILSSKWEGWGAVINEAIAEGTRVITSDAPGAACLLQLGDVGDQFPSGDVDALTALLRQHLSRGPVGKIERIERRALHARINGPAMARYFEEIIAGRGPKVLWS